MNVVEAKDTNDKLNNNNNKISNNKHLPNMQLKKQRKCRPIQDFKRKKQPIQLGFNKQNRYKLVLLLFPVSCVATSNSNRYPASILKLID